MCTDLTAASDRGRPRLVISDPAVILAQAAVGQAPLGLSTTGDPRLNAPWTAAVEIQERLERARDV